MSISSNPPSLFTCRLQNTVGEIASLTDDFMAWGLVTKIPSPGLEYIGLMLDELIANIAMHAYSGNEKGWMEVEATCQGTSVCIRLRDYGPPFDPTHPVAVDTEQDIDEWQIGGLGLFLVQHLADRLSYHRLGDANETVFCKSVFPEQKQSDTTDS